jgi:hypothetical protein
MVPAHGRGLGPSALRVSTHSEVRAVLLGQPRLMQGAEGPHPNLPLCEGEGIFLVGLG